MTDCVCAHETFLSLTYKPVAPARAGLIPNGDLSFAREVHTRFQRSLPSSKKIYTKTLGHKNYGL